MLNLTDIKSSFPIIFLEKVEEEPTYQDIH